MSSTGNNAPSDPGNAATRTDDPEKTKTQIMEESLRVKIAELERLFKTEQQNREALRLSEERYRLVVDLIDGIVFDWDFATDTMMLSEKFTTVFGWDTVWYNVRTNPGMREKVHPDDRLVFEEWVRSTYRKSGVVKMEYRIATAAGAYLWVRLDTVTISDERGDPVRAVGVVSNINNQKTEMNSLTIKAQLDPLTQLLNKEECRRRIEAHLAANPEKPAALFIVDVDNFKGVNDTLGHQFGDTVLRDVANRIKETFRDSDIVGRLGGDEFSIFLCDIKSRDIVERKAQQLSTSLRRTYFGTTTKYTISGSVGVTYYPSHGDSFDELYKMADVALYQAKRMGKDRYAIYTAEMVMSMERRKEQHLTPLDWSERFLSTYFSGDPIFGVFQMLYETKDIRTTIQLLLEQIGRRFEVDRAYIFEHSEDYRSISNTYEWCAPGIPSEKDTLQNLPMETIQPFLNQYNPEGIFCRTDISGIAPEVYDILKRQGIRSVLHCAIHNEGMMTGFIGFDSCRETRIWRGEEIASLGYISRVLSVFLVRTRIKQELLDSYANYVEMLDNLNGYVYVIDTDTYDLLYANKMVLETGMLLGRKCYAEAFGAEAPCPTCPAHKLNGSTPHASEIFYSVRAQHWVNSAVSKMTWTGGRNAALVCCTEIGGSNPDIRPDGAVA